MPPKNNQGPAVINAASNSNDRSPNAEWMTLAEFKTLISADKVDIVKNPHTGKFFMTANGQNYKVQQSLFVTGDMVIPEGKELKVMFPNGTKHEDAMTDLCLQAATISNNLVVTL